MQSHYDRFIALRAGLFFAYHMNKEHWITIALNGSVSDDKIKMLVDLSFEATAPKQKNRK